ncbi:histidine-type phosphatase [Viscerimonas tarda]
MEKINSFILILLLAICNMVAQTTQEEIFETPEKFGGVNYAYPVKNITSKTPAPESYEPFYISHFGRHGSRYLVSDNEYKHLLDVFQEADSCNALTASGKDVYRRLKTIWQEAEGHGGELTPLGTCQQRGIAERMYKQYPEVFSGNAQVTAVSTTVGRCIRSMEIFCRHLTDLSTGLSVSQDTDPRHMDYLNYHTEQAVQFRYSPDTWKEKYNQFEKEHVYPERLVKNLFSDNRFLQEKINADALMWELYNVASSTQNMQTDISLYDLFEKEELFDLWQCKNYSLYVQYANAAENGGIMMENAKPLLKNIIENANHVIKTKGNGASFRFGHDGNIIPLAMLLHLKDCYNSVSNPSEFYKAWNDFKVAPMAGNIQIVFFRKKGSDDILVKFLHNENEILVPPVKSDVLPYYHWSDLVEYYGSFFNKSAVS